ncbi:glycoside hydrolase family 25 protein [Paenibacillus caui]|uniref:glycoside hydrolase family 25 protein n=1 Tax=Paenibacillus caui TaxID=2873927 RepID=UPI001CA82494|nr:glycoside hydrolase family 25 protein [Paenibacillus caui]
MRKGRIGMQPRNSRNAKGIDVSHHNGSIDWGKVAASGCTFVFIKASEGQSYQDSRYIVNVKGAKEAGLLIGAYHFLNATTAEAARREADHFAGTIKAAGGIGFFDLPPVLDYEINPGGLTAPQICTVAEAFLTELEKLTGRAPILYTGNAFAVNFNATFGKYKLWVARYNNQPPKDTTAWTRWDFWQYSDSGTINGIDGKVDLNEFNGTLDELNQSMGHDQQEQEQTQEEESEMEQLKVLQEQLNKLEQTLKAQDNRISILEKIVNVSGNQEIPAWSADALAAAKAAGAITTSADKGKAELVGLQILYNLGLLKKHKDVYF